MAEVKRLALLRRGYWHDWLVLFIVTVVVGAAVAGGIAWGVDTLFGDVVNRIAGDVGEYDVLVQWNTADDVAVQDEAIAWLSRRYPGAQLQAGPTVGNQAYFFVKFPPHVRNEHTFDRLDETLGEVPGYAGYTVLIEPSLVINQIHDAVADDIQSWAQSHADIDFSFRQRANLVLVLRDPQKVSTVQQELTALLTAHQLIDVRPAPGATFADTAAVQTTVQQVAAGLWPQATVRAYGPGDGLATQVAPLLGTLKVLQQLLVANEQLNPMPGVAPAETWGVGDDAEEAVAHLAPLLAQLRKAVDQIQTVDEQLTQINNAVAVLNGKTGGSPLQALLGGFDVGTLTALLDTLIVGTGVGGTAEGAVPMETLGQLAEQLPLLDDGDVTAAMSAMEQFVDTQATGEKVTVMAPAGADVDALRQVLIGEESADAWRVQSTVAGVVAPNARLALAQVLGQFRSLVAAFVTVIVVIVFLVFDQSVVVSANKTIMPVAGGADGKSIGWMFNVVAGTGLGLAVASLSGAVLPWVGWAGWLLVGLVAGTTMWVLAPRLSPIDVNEVVAGTSFGLSEVQLMRRIVVPQARPGLLTLLNRRHHGPVPSTGAAGSV